MLPKVGVVGNGYSNVRLAIKRKYLCSLTLFSGQESQLVRRATVVGIALSVITIFEDNTEAVELFHQNLDNC
jgi:hypothetical protein